MTDPLFDVAGRVVVVTGAGRGIGRALALAFARRGARLVLASRTLAEVEAAAAECRDAGAAATVAALDVRAVASADRLATAAVAAHGRLDVLINNAGLFLNVPALEMTEEAWDVQVDTNLKGAFFCARAAARAMIAGGRGGRIVNISSALAGIAAPGYACYGATKAGLEHLTRVLALEWAPHGILVNGIAPTTTVTPERAERLGSLESRERARRVPLGRFAVPEDLVGAALYLASPASQFMTGQTLRLDGGLGLP